MKRPKKASNTEVTVELLKARVEYSIKLGYSKQKWVEFCEHFLAQGYHLSLYEARRTVSKYITVSRGRQRFKVRFSNHKPIEHREKAGDCDFFVGRTNLKVTTTRDAIRATEEYFKREIAPLKKADEYDIAL